MHASNLGRYHAARRWIITPPPLADPRRPEPLQSVPGHGRAFVDLERMSAEHDPLGDYPIWVHRENRARRDQVLPYTGSDTVSAGIGEGGRCNEEGGATGRRKQ